MTSFSRCAIAIGMVISLAGPARVAQAQVIVLGGGYAQSCYEMSRAITKGEEVPQADPITGSQISLTPLEVCTIAIRDSDLTAHDLAGTYNNRGVIYASQAKSKTAVADFKKSISIEPRIAEVYVNLGAELITQKRWQEAMAALNTCIELQPDSLEKAYYDRAIVHEELGDARGAYFDYLKAAELSPNWEAPRTHLARFTVHKKS